MTIPFEIRGQNTKGPKKHVHGGKVMPCFEIKISVFGKQVGFPFF